MKGVSSGMPSWGAPAGGILSLLRLEAARCPRQDTGTRPYAAADQSNPFFRRSLRWSLQKRRNVGAWGRGGGEAEEALKKMIPVPQLDRSTLPLTEVGAG